jgi:glucose-1-phosphate cytidylyltransferase
MKVVLFCGGRGLRLREHSEAIPKPMVRIGYRPILWHVMRYYAHFGHRDFILCLGYRGDVVKDYFLHYDEAVSNDFVLSDGGRRIELLGSDIADWRITFADTGLDTTIGERLRRVRHLLAGEEMFLANYGDTLTDAPLDRLVEDFRSSDAVAGLLSVRPTYSFHVVETDDGGRVTDLPDVTAAALRINGGGYLFRPEILDRLGSGEDLVDAPFAGLAEAGGLVAFPYDGFWASLDTLKDLELLQRLDERDAAPWAVWRRAAAGNGTDGTGSPSGGGTGEPGAPDPAGYVDVPEGR